MQQIYVPRVGSWAEIDRFARGQVDKVNWPEAFPYAPEVSFAIAHTSSVLFLKFYVIEQDASAVCHDANGPVWEDSCVEFFVKHPGSEYYFNFETNCLGTPLVGRRKSRNDCSHFTSEELSAITRRIELLSDGRWSLEMEIPFSSLGLDSCPERLRANFYKCGDKTAVPHFLSWSPIDTPKPDFHRPEFFGELIFAGAHESPLTVQTPDGSTKVLLHTCCAPCSGAIIESLLSSGIVPTIYYSNPNIFPREEYDIRMNECTRYAGMQSVPIVEDPYEHEAWQEWITGLENEPERGGRCLECFRYRLLRSARYAIEHGFTVLTTTLASSRWKSLEQIDSAGEWAVAKANEELEPREPLIWWKQNWRKGGLQPRRGEIIKEMNFYNQLYCGCEFSMRTLEK